MYIVYGQYTMAPAPLLRIDLAARLPVYLQIADGLRHRLVSSEFQPGEQLPTVRQLALDLGVHHNTVAEAYRLLAEEGWLDLRRRRGAVVVERPAPARNPKARSGFAKSLRELVARAIAEGVPERTIAGELSALTEQLSEE